jgi:uncharacterized coiled-coil protein SlyX
MNEGPKPPRAVLRAHKKVEEPHQFNFGRRTWEKVLNIVWLVATVGFFAWNMFGHGKLASVSLEIGILLISLKLAWSINQNAKINHYEFWILQTLDFKLNDLRHDIHRQRKKIDSLEAELKQFGVENSVSPEEEDVPPRRGGEA